MLRNNVSKDKLASDLSEELGFSNRYSKEIIADFIEIIKNELIDKKVLHLMNFSTFKIKFKNKRIGRNPRTKEEHSISERYVINFKASKKLTTYLND